MVNQFIDVMNPSMNYSFIQVPLVTELQGIYAQGFSDSTEIAELRNDLTQVPRTSEVVIFTLRSLMSVLARILWKLITPKVVLSLKPGEVRRISVDLLVEKTKDGRIILYEVLE